ncbi:S10 family peptidase [Gimesia aquarii]|uniref:Serine carboxypeptidase n=1 Tax=Gimesia aquarii TaxID=2527964 RepID=A0A517W3T7_9PLAN|nr:peptidase S10 [Gimesia aquarii]QDT99919.1 Serine carboxypeptidase [Gimesia aquarii]
MSNTNQEEVGNLSNAEYDFPKYAATTEHTLQLSSGPLAYKAVADWISLRKIYKPVAHLFYTAYIAEPQDCTRPLTFVFNGGPGAASAYLHMGALGPKRVAFGKMGSLPEPPTQVVDNQETWLSFTDLVFIDPVGTGFSRALKEPGANKNAEGSKEKFAESGPEENPEFWEIEKDLDALGEFICRFLSKYHRWTSPLFIAGESYGGFRVARMARRLQEKHGVGLCGALLISPAIELDALLDSDYNLAHWIELFPSLVAAAHHHGRTEDLGNDDIQSQGESFANNELVRWLAQGEALPADELALIVGRMSALTGLSATVLERAGGRISATMFSRELLRGERRLCGRYDASVTTVDPFPDRNGYEGPDPTLFSIDRLFTGAINHHLRTNLKVETELDYRLLSMQVNEKWKDKSNRHFFVRQVGAMDDLRYGMSLNGHMKVSITHGRFDLVTPYFGSQRLTKLMKLTDEQKSNLTCRNFDGGHMFYSWDESRIEFHSQMQNFYQSALPGDRDA